MTAPALLRVLARRWYVVLIVLAVAGAGFITLDRAGGAFVSESTVIFVPPGSAALGVFDDRKRDTLVEFVAAVELEANEGRQPDRLPESAPLFGAGVSEGSQVVLPNTGGQWQYSFPDPVLSVRVTGSSPEQVRVTMDSLLDRIDSIAADRQQSLDGWVVISTERVPVEVTVGHVGGSRRTQARALLALGLVGLGAAAVAAVAVDRLAGRFSLQRRRDRPAGLAPQPDPASGVEADAHPTERVT